MGKEGVPDVRAVEEGRGVALGRKRAARMRPTRAATMGAPVQSSGMAGRPCWTEATAR